MWPFGQSQWGKKPYIQREMLYGQLNNIVPSALNSMYVGASTYRHADYVMPFLPTGAWINNAASQSAKPPQPPANYNGSGSGTRFGKAWSVF